MREYYQIFLNVAMAVSSLMAIVWLMRIRSKGTTAYLMASAFVVFSGLLFATKVEAPIGFKVALGILLALLLGADVAVRAARQAEERDKSA